MQSNVAEILTAAAGVTDITKATARPFREADEYPLFYCGSRELPAGENEATTIRRNRYNQNHKYVCHIYVEANDSDTDYSDYTLAERLGDEFLALLLVNAKWVFESGEQYPAKLGHDNVIVNELVLSKNRVKQYGN